MSGKPTELGYKKDIARCRFCREVILWGYKFGKKHPYDVSFDTTGYWVVHGGIGLWRKVKHLYKK